MLITKTQWKDILNSLNAHKDIIEAYASGKAVQWRRVPHPGYSNPPWMDLDDSMCPNFLPSNQYRVKPERRKVTIATWAIVRFDDGRVFFRQSKVAADRFLNTQRALGFDAVAHLLTQVV